MKLSEITAIQPNYHNSETYLPLDLDDARYDGFGVVIVTVGISASVSDGISATCASDGLSSAYASDGISTACISDGTTIQQQYHV